MHPRSTSSESSGHWETPAALEDAIADYLRAVEANPELNHERFVASYPQWARELRDFIASQREISAMVRSIGTPPHEPPADSGPLPRRVGEYELLEVLGRGGMGIVFKARQDSLDRCVALKMLGHEHDSGRFQTEAEAAAALDHPNIVAIYEIGQHQGLPFYSMQFVDGGDLRRLLLDGPVAPKIAAQMTAKIAGAVEYAHQRGILHRDLKPGNVLVDRQGELYVTDFGLARRLSDASWQTQSGTIVGTPSYMAPEQADGSQQSVTTAIDVYGLGALLYAMLTGRAPFEGEHPFQVLRQVVDQAPQPPRAIQPTIPRDLEMICLKCLEKRPGDRYHSAFDLQQDLLRFLSGEAVVARPLDWRGRMIRRCRRNPVATGLAGLVVLMLIATAIGGSALAWKEYQARRLAVESGIREGEARRQAVFELIDSYMNHARQAQRLSRQAESLLWYAAAADLARDTPQVADAMVRGFRRQRFVPQPIRAAALPAGLAALSFHPSGRYLLCADNSHTLHLWDIAEMRPALGINRFGRIQSSAWSPDGRFVAVGNEAGQLRVIDLANGQLVLEKDLAESIRAICFDPAGQWVIAASGMRGELFDLAAGAVRETSSDPLRCCQVESPIEYLEVNEAGTHLLVQSLGGFTTVFEVGDPLRRMFDPILHQPPENESSTVPRPFFVDDQRIAVLEGNQLKVVEVAQGTATLLQTIAHSFVWKYDRARKLLAVGSYRQAQLWSLNSGSMIGQIGHREPVTAIAFRPGTNELATSSLDGRVSLWDLATGRRIGDLQHQSQVSSLQFSPQGDLLATAQLDGLARIWQLARDTVSRESFPNTMPELPARIASSSRGQILAVGKPADSNRTTLERIPFDRSPQAHGDELTFDGQLLDFDSTADGHTIVAAIAQAPAPVAESPKPPDYALEILRESPRDWSRAKIPLPNEPVSVSIQPHGTLAAVTSQSGDTILYDIASTRVARRLPTVGGDATAVEDGHRAEFSRDGRWLVIFGDSDGIEVYHQDGNWSSRGHLTAQGPISGVEFDADSQRLLAVCGQREVIVWDLESLTQHGAPYRHEEVVYQAHFSPDGKKLATACADNYARVFDVRTGELACQTVTHWVDVFDAVFSSDGRWLLTFGDNSLLGVWSARDGGFVDQIVVSADRTEGSAELRAARILVPDSGTSVAVAGRRPQIDLIQLGAFEADGQRTSSQLRMLAELSASAKIERGGPRPLSTAEWVGLWNAYSRLYAEELTVAMNSGPDFTAAKAAMNQ